MFKGADAKVGHTAVITGAAFQERGLSSAVPTVVGCTPA